MDNCQECGARTSTPAARRVGRQIFSARVATFCDRCGNFRGGVARHVAEYGPAGNSQNARAAAFSCLVEYLGENGLAAKDLAGLLGRTPEAVSRWSHNKQPFDAATWATVAALVAETVEGKTTTLERLERLRAAEKQPARVEIEIPRRTRPDLRAQRDDQRQAIVNAVDQFVDHIKSEKRSDRRIEDIKRRARLGKHQADPFGDFLLQMLPLTENGKPTEALDKDFDPDFDTDQGNRIFLLRERLRAIDARLSDAVGRLGRELSDPERVRANTKFTIAARLACEAGIEDRREGETRDDAANRLAGRYRRALQRA